MTFPTNPGSINDTLFDLSELIVFSAYIVQYEGQIVGYDNDPVAYEHDLI
jgi:hypothetical protein